MSRTPVTGKDYTLCTKASKYPEYVGRRVSSYAIIIQTLYSCCFLSIHLQVRQTLFHKEASHSQFCRRWWRSVRRWRPCWAQHPRGRYWWDCTKGLQTAEARSEWQGCSEKSRDKQQYCSWEWRRLERLFMLASCCSSHKGSARFFMGTSTAPAAGLGGFWSSQIAERNWHDASCAYQLYLILQSDRYLFSAVNMIEATSCKSQMAQKRVKKGFLTASHLGWPSPRYLWWERNAHSWIWM